MDELIRIIWTHLDSDEGPELYDDEGEQLNRTELLEVAQSIAGAIVAAGWPRSGS